jgi:hypothetical protein
VAQIAGWIVRRRSREAGRAQGRLAKSQAPGGAYPFTAPIVIPWMK